MTDEELEELRNVARSDATSGRALTAKVTALRTLERIERQRKPKRLRYPPDDPLAYVDLDDFNLHMGLIADFDALTALDFFDGRQMDAAWELFGAELREKNRGYELWPDFRERVLHQHERAEAERRRLDMGG